MWALVKWTNLSRRQIVRRLNELETPVSRRVVTQYTQPYTLWSQPSRREFYLIEMPAINPGTAAPSPRRP